MKQLIFSTLLAIFFISGCTVYQIDSKDTTVDFFPPKKSIEDVKYLERVDQPYEQIGIVSVTTERRQSLEDVIPKLKQEAAMLGGDVITDVQSDATGTWKNVTLQKLFGNAHIRSNYTAKVLILK